MALRITFNFKNSDASIKIHVRCLALVHVNLDLVKIYGEMFLRDMNVLALGVCTCLLDPFLAPGGC